jgi:hypothetical protein
MHRAFRPAALLLALTAMLLGAMLPAGWMPGTDGAPVMCSLDAPAHHRPDHKAPAGPASQHECPFAAASHLGPPLTHVALVAPYRVFMPVPARQATARRAAFTAYTPQAPRAPPAIA